MEDLSSCGMMNTKEEMETIPLSGTDFLDYSIEDDACSICLEPFSCSDPSTVTGCKHEYHLQCILEWSQRSKECPICWRALVLKDPASQELLEAVEIERNSRSRQRSSTSSMFAQTSPEHYDFEPIPYSVESELDEHIMEHLRTAVLGRARHFGRRQRHSRSPGLDQFLAFSEPSDDSDLQETPAGSQSSGNPSSPESDSERNIHSAAIHNQPTPHILTSYNTDPNVTDIQQNSSRPRGTESQTSPESPRRSRPSEVLSFSETLKSKFAAASARYKESITKSTRGLKEKLLARNNSVKELSKEVQREVTASIAGVARMMERLDPNIKNSGGSSPISTDEVGTSNLSHNGKGVQGSQITPSPNGVHLETSHGTSSHSPIPGPGGLSSV